MLRRMRTVGGWVERQNLPGLPWHGFTLCQLTNGAMLKSGAMFSFLGKGFPSNSSGKQKVPRLLVAVQWDLGTARSGLAAGWQDAHSALRDVEILQAPAVGWERWKDNSFVQQAVAGCILYGAHGNCPCGF